jgi:nicotinamide mononucleotide transporter PnuC
MKCISGAAAFTGVLSVVLTAKGKLSSFFWGAINSLLYGLFSLAYGKRRFCCFFFNVFKVFFLGYTGDAQLNLFFFLPLQFIGLYQWSKSVESSLLIVSPSIYSSFTVKSHSLSFQKQFFYLFVTFLLSLIFYYEIPWFAILLEGEYYFQGQLFPRLFDSCCNGFSIVAQILCLLQYTEQWIWWIVVDFLQIAMYCGIAGYGTVINIVLMWFLFLCNACYGLHSWRKRTSFTRNYREEAEQQQQKYYSCLLSYEEQDRIPEEECIRYNVLIEETEVSKKSSRSSVDGKIALQKTDDLQVNYQIPFSFTKDEVLSPDDLELLKDPSYSLCRDPFAVGNMNHCFSTPLSQTIRSSSSSNCLKGPPIRGVIIGKFWPFHAGHQYLCEQAAKHCDELYLILCHRSYHFPSKDIRLHWIRSTLPFAYCAAILDIYDPLDSELWALLTKAWCGFSPDVVFTSESYGEVWAKCLGCRHVMIDLNRLEVPVSGTMIRENLYDCLLLTANTKKKEGRNYLQALDTCWKYLPTVVKHYFTKQVVIISEKEQWSDNNESYSSLELCSELSAYFNSCTVRVTSNNSEVKEFQQKLLLYHQREVNAVGAVHDRVDAESKSKFLILDGSVSFHSFILSMAMSDITFSPCSQQILETFSLLSNHSTLVLLIMQKNGFSDYQNCIEALLKRCSFSKERILYYHIDLQRKLQQELVEECKNVIEGFIH